VLDPEALTALGELLSFLGLACGALLCFRHADAVAVSMSNTQALRQSEAFPFPRTDWHLMSRASHQLPASRDDRVAA
jgi:hypothetical protein